MRELKMNSELKRSSKENELERMDFHRRFMDLIYEAGNPNAFANKTSISPSGVQRIIDGGTPGMPILIKICDAFNISTDWLARGIGSKYLSEPLKCVDNIKDNAGNLVDLNDFTFIPHYDISASVGHPDNFCKENFMFSMAYRTHWVKNYLRVNPKALIAMTARGDSMLGVIDDRDVMIVDTDNKSLADGIFVLKLDGDVLVKRAQKLPEVIVEISSANPVYRPFQINMKKPPNGLDVVGAVVHTEPDTLFRYRKYSDTI